MIGHGGALSHSGGSLNNISIIRKLLGGDKIYLFV